MLIRPETSDDNNAIYDINSSAFDTTAEARLVDRLREEARPYLSLVAETDHGLVGHIMFSPVDIPGKQSVKIMGLGPMAVRPEHQRTGIGSRLVEAGLESCRQMGIGAVVVLGHPEYYPRFGFTPAHWSGIACEYQVPQEAFMVLELQPGILDGVSGTVSYHKAFNDV